jgi:hypothetical protein
MSQASPQSSSGRGPASSPFAGTDPTLYSPDMARTAKHRRGDTVTTVVGHGGKAAVNKVNILPHPASYVQGAFVNELVEDTTDFISRYQMVVHLPDGTSAGLDMDHELFSVQHQMKLVSILLFLFLS